MINDKNKMLKTMEENYKTKSIVKQVHIVEPDQFGEFCLQQDRNIYMDVTKSPRNLSLYKS